MFQGVPAACYRRSTTCFRVPAARSGSSGSMFKDSLTRLESATQEVLSIDSKFSGVPTAKLREGFQEVTSDLK